MISPKVVASSGRLSLGLKIRVSRVLKGHDGGGTGGGSGGGGGGGGLMGGVHAHLVLLIFPSLPFHFILNLSRWSSLVTISPPKPGD